MNYYYVFREHDQNNDGFLDGLELLQAITHHMPVTVQSADIDQSLPYLERRKKIKERQEQWLLQMSGK